MLYATISNLINAYDNKIKAENISIDDVTKKIEYCFEPLQKELQNIADIKETLVSYLIVKKTIAHYDAYITDKEEMMTTLNNLSNSYRTIESDINRVINYLRGR